MRSLGFDSEHMSDRTHSTFCDMCTRKGPWRAGTPSVSVRGKALGGTTREAVVCERNMQFRPTVAYLLTAELSPSRRPIILRYTVCRRSSCKHTIFNLVRARPMINTPHLVPEPSCLRLTTKSAAPKKAKNRPHLLTGLKTHILRSAKERPI